MGKDQLQKGQLWKAKGLGRTVRVTDFDKHGTRWVQYEYVDGHGDWMGNRLTLATFLLSYIPVKEA